MLAGMKTRWFVVSCSILALGACEDRAPAGPAPSAAPTPSAAPIAAPSAKPSAAVAPPTGSTAPAAVPSTEPEDTWLVVSKLGTELGVIELRKGKPPKLMVTGTGADAVAGVAELKKKLDAIDGPEGIAIDMHEPPPSGVGRGPLGSRIAKYDDVLYRHALKHALEPTFGVKEVPYLNAPMPPAKLQRVEVSQSGEKHGAIDFSSKPPKLELPKDSTAGSLKTHWEELTERGTLSFRYHHTVDGVQRLETVEAKPGDASYAQSAVLFLILMKDYKPRHSYELVFSE